MYQITGADELLRRIIRQPQFTKMNLDGTERPTSAAFKLNRGEDGISVDILALTTIPQAINLSTHTGAILLAQVPLALSCPCVHNPVPGNNAHALILNVTPSMSRKLALGAKLI